MTTRRWMGVLVTVSGLLASCSNTPPPMSCTVTNTMGTFCVDFVAGYTGATASAACTQLMGSYSSSVSCPAQGRVGRCTETFTNSGGSLTLIANAYSPYTTVQAQGQCPPPMPTTGVMYEFQAN